MQDLIQEMNKIRQELNQAIHILKQRGQDKAKAEHDYRVALAKEILIQRDAGQPVTIISDICRGNKAIAKLKLERDIANTLYETVFEKIRISKMELNILDNQLRSEWKGDGN
jgi:hypothetical protein